MSKIWKKINNHNIWVADYKVPSFISRSVAIQLKNGNFLIYSAGANLIESAKEELFSLGKPEALVVPNVFHHMGVKKWLQEFPDLKVFGAKKAFPRLKKQGLSSLIDFYSLQNQLPEGIDILEPKGMKGEVWLQAEFQGSWTWILCDAFMNMSQPPKNFWMRKVMKFLKASPGLSISSLFMWMGLSNRKEYKTWLIQQINERKPNQVIFSHGKILQGDFISKDLLKLAQDRL
jgi:hypothetical protein